MPDLRFLFGDYPRPGILQILDDWHLIDFNPQYQRKGGAWSLERKQYFIDSIINGMDLTKLYFHELPPDKLGPDSIKYGVIDGKQRLETIRGFVNDDFSLSNEFEYLHDDEEQAAGKTYSELLIEYPALRERFDDTILPVTVMYAEDEVLIEGLFVRLNEQVTLSAPEKRNAFGGPLPLRIRELANHDFFTHNIPFPDGRYRHRDLAAKFLFIVLQNRFVSTKRLALDNFVKEYRSDPNPNPEPDTLLQKAQEILDVMSHFFGHDDRLLQNVGWITLYFHLFRIGQISGLPETIRTEHFSHFVGEVTTARALVRKVADGDIASSEVEVNPDLAQFDSLRQSPNDATALRTRYAILRRYFKGKYDIDLPEENY